MNATGVEWTAGSCGQLKGYGHQHATEQEEEDEVRRPPPEAAVLQQAAVPIPAAASGMQTTLRLDNHTLIVLSETTISHWHARRRT